MARPKLGQEKNAKCGMAIRVSPDERQSLQDLAARHGRSLTDELRTAIREYIAREQRRKAS